MWAGMHVRPCESLVIVMEYLSFSFSHVDPHLSSGRGERAFSLERVPYLVQRVCSARRLAAASIRPFLAHESHAQGSGIARIQCCFQFPCFKVRWEDASFVGKWVHAPHTSAASAAVSYRPRSARAWACGVLGDNCARAGGQACADPMIPESVCKVCV